ncbi:putative sterigmatocystin biosynthesis monooxygenase stcW [Fusarium oxysporum f. sp. albedinis]|nr:putative sterigmatocystin biosynthesis monooxygenase stcW [Fusarium oxysporum f. sp. albedinis]
MQYPTHVFATGLSLDKMPITAGLKARLSRYPSASSTNQNHAGQYGPAHPGQEKGVDNTREGFKEKSQTS